MWASNWTPVGARAKATLGKACKLDAFVVQSSCNFPGAVAVPAMYFLVTDQFVHAFGPILNLLSAATSTAAAGSRICEFLVHSVKKVFYLLLPSLLLVSAPTITGSGESHMVRDTCSACLLPLWVLLTWVVILPISCTLSLLLMEIPAPLVSPHELLFVLSL